MILILKKTRQYAILFIIILTTIFVGLSLYFSLFYIDTDTRIFSNQRPLYMVVLLVVTCLLVGTFYIFFRFISNKPNKQVQMIILLLCGINVLLSAAYIYFMRTVPVTDAYMMISRAWASANGQKEISDNVSRTFDGYWGRYGNNYFTLVLMTYYFKGLIRVGCSNYYLMLQVANFFVIFLGNVLLIAIAYRWYGIRKACKLLLFCVFNPITYIGISWVYTSFLSIPVMLGIILLAINVEKGKSNYIKIVSVSGIAILSVLGYYIRATALIPVIALFICKLLKKKWCIRSVILCSVVFMISAMGMTSIVKKSIEKSIPESAQETTFPISHWLMMGLHGNGTYNDEDADYTASYESEEEKIKANLERLSANLKDENLTGIANLLMRKHRLTWSDGSIAQKYRMTPSVKFTSIYSYIAWGKTDFFFAYCQAYRIFTYIFILVSLTAQWGKTKAGSFDFKMLLFTLTLLGVFVFYLFWEAKSDYSIPFLPIMFMLLLNGFEVLEKKIDNHVVDKNIIGKGFVILTFISILFMIMTAKYFVIDEYRLEERSIYVTGGGPNRELTGLKTEKQTLTQTFYANKRWNTLSLLVKNNASQSEGKYIIEIFDKDNKEILVKNVSSQDVNQWGALNLGLNKAQKAGNYKLRIQGVDSEEDSIVFLCRGFNALDSYEGECFLNDEQRLPDLCLRVYNEYYASYFKPSRYLGICMVIVIYEVLISMYYLHNRKQKVQV